MNAKALLKEARTALKREDYQVASEFAQDVLELEPDNYVGYDTIRSNTDY